MIEIDYPNEGKIYCPACGTLTLSFGELGNEFEISVDEISKMSPEEREKHNESLKNKG